MLYQTWLCCGTFADYMEQLLQTSAVLLMVLLRSILTPACIENQINGFSSTHNYLSYYTELPLDPFDSHN